MPATVIIRSGIAETIWQARDVDLPQPDPHTPHLADVVPSVLAAMGVAGFDRRIDLAGEVRGACVLLVDGLGAELLDAYADDAPVMAALRGRTLQAGFPSTTVAGLAAVGTGCRSGEHGMVGMSFRLPGVGVINSLRWRPHPWGDDLRETAPPEQVQPMATTFERAAVGRRRGERGLRCGVQRFRADPRGAARRPLRRGAGARGSCRRRAGRCRRRRASATATTARWICSGICTVPARRRGGCNCGRSTGWSSPLVEGLPPGGLLAIVADHGMVAAEDDDVVDIDDCAALLDGVQAIGGEPRARHVYVDDGAADAVLAAWRETLADRAWVVSRDEAIAAGWFGEPVRDDVRARIGDVVAAARGSATMVRRTVEPLESSLVGHHGSLTSAEQRIPLLLAYG